MLGVTMNFCTLAAVLAYEQCRSFQHSWQKMGKWSSREILWKCSFSRIQQLYGSGVTSMKLDEFINCSELLILLLHYRQSILRTASLYDINFD